MRYGNVLASRGSVIPLFLEQIASGGPVTITTPEMTRFLLSLDEAVDTVFAGASRRRGRARPTSRERRPARMVDVAKALIGDRQIEIECDRHPARREDPRDPGLRGGGAADAGARRLLVIAPILPELRDPEPRASPSAAGVQLGRRT